MGLHLNNNNDNKIMADINMTPLIDIMLVLLIIFMVTSSLSLESGLDIQLPETSSKTTPQESKAVLVSLDRNGKISVQGTIVAFEDLKVSIKDALIQEQTKEVVFEGDHSSNLGRAISIMDLAREAGAEKFAIAAQSKE